MRSLALVMTLVLSVAAAAPALAEDGPKDTSGPPVTVSSAEAEGDGRYIVRYREDADVDVAGAAEALARASDAVEVAHVYEHVFDGFAAELTDAELDALRDDPRVLSIDEDAPVRLFRQDSDEVRAAATQVGAIWGLDRIDQRTLPLSGSFTYPNLGSGVTVYVIDTGIRADHVDFAGRVLPGFTAVQDGYGTGDCDGHGTHVAGTVGGTVHGVAKGVTLRPVRVLDCNGEGDISDIVAGLDWVIGHHAYGQPAVANLSLGAEGDELLDMATQAVANDGVSVVTAAGNEGAPACEVSPARLPAAVTVAATDINDYSPNWSNWGACLDLFAPGVDILSASHTSTTGTIAEEGTSMAAPHVAGAAALHLGFQPRLSPSQVASMLTSTATTGVVSNEGAGSPNRLLFVPQEIVTPPAGPVNDDFAAATTFAPMGPSPLQGSNVHATKEPGEPDHAFSAGGKSVWWRFVAPTDGALMLSTQGSGFDTLLAVYTGASVSSLTRVADNDDYDSTASRVTVRARAGTTYHVAVDGWFGSEGPVVLHHTWTPPLIVSLSDIAGSVHEASIVKVAQAGITSGFPDGTFRPNDPVTRGQMATFLTRALDLPPGDPSQFSDVAGSVHADSIGALVRAGITSGFPDGTFRPNAPVTRGQMATFLTRALWLPPGDWSQFSDVAGSVHADSIGALVGADITSGYPDGTFRPTVPVTRGQMATFLTKGLHL
jgi:subtilisin family serine protease